MSDKYSKFKEYGPYYCGFLACNGTEPDYNNFVVADRMFANITGKPPQLMTDEQRKEINDRCRYMAMSYYEDELKDLKRRELVSNHFIAWIITVSAIVGLTAFNSALWLMGDGANTQTYSKQQIIERVQEWK